jgi:hypothetical protein
MDVNQLMVITRFLEIHKQHGADVACAWAAEREVEMDQGCFPNLEAPVSLDKKRHLRIVG